MQNVDAALTRRTVAAPSKPSNVIPRCLWSPLQTEDMNDGNATVRPGFPSPTRIDCLVARATPDPTPVDFRLTDLPKANSTVSDAMRET
jgi:hypothetical protein